MLTARAVVDEANTLVDARGDAAYAGLLRQRRLDPESAALRARLRPALATLESGVQDLQQHVTLLRNAGRKPKQRRVQLPSYERIYRTLEAQYRVIVNLTDVKKKNKITKIEKKQNNNNISLVCGIVGTTCQTIRNISNTNAKGTIVEKDIANAVAVVTTSISKTTEKKNSFRYTYKYI